MRANTVDGHDPVVFRLLHVQAVQKGPPSLGGSIVLIGGEWLHIDTEFQTMLTRWVESGYITARDVIGVGDG